MPKNAPRHVGALLLHLLPFASCQTFSYCNPLENACPSNPALGTTAVYDFTSDGMVAFENTTDTPIGKSSILGAEFRITKASDAPTIQLPKYILLGKVEFHMRCAPGVGVVTSIVLQSDCLDEIDFVSISSRPWATFLDC